MEGSRLIHQLKLRDFLSYGSAGVEIDLQPLNVLIGPNASGKSNLIEALGVLQAAPSSLEAYFRRNGGAAEYIYHGAGTSEVAMIQATVMMPGYSIDPFLRHTLEFASRGQRLQIVGEEVKAESHHLQGAAVPSSTFYQMRQDDLAVRISAYTGGAERADVEIPLDDLKSDQSGLSQWRDPQRYPEITYLAQQLDSVALYQNWSFGKHNPARVPQRTDLPSGFLLPDGSNLGLVLHELMQRSTTRTKVLEYLGHVYEDAQFLTADIYAGSVSILIEDRQGTLVPAMRLSDGTLRFLTLLAVLCHPSPPPLICIEEPELGLHPDVIPTVAELLKEASQRTQLVVTTHSDALVSALSDTPESVIVCESGIDGTSLRRLDPGQLASWLDKFSLGEIWRTGEIGGNRW